MKLTKRDEPKWNAITYTIEYTINRRVYRCSRMFWREQFREYRSIIARDILQMRSDLRRCAINDSVTKRDNYWVDL